MHLIDEMERVEWAKGGDDEELGESEEPLLLGTARGRKADAAYKGREAAYDHREGVGHYNKRNVHFGNRKAETHDAAV